METECKQLCSEKSQHTKLSTFAKHTNPIINLTIPCNNYHFEVLHLIFFQNIFIIVKNHSP